MKYAVLHTDAAARLFKAQTWKNAETPPENSMKDEIFETVKMDILSERLKEGNLDKISKRWKHDNRSLENLDGRMSKLSN